MAQIGYNTPFGDNAYFDHTLAYMYVSNKYFYKNKIHHMRYDIKPIKRNDKHIEGSNNGGVGGHWNDNEEYEIGDIVTYDGIKSTKISYEKLPNELKIVYDSPKFKDIINECKKQSMENSDWTTRNKIINSNQYKKHMKILNQVSKILGKPYRTCNATAVTRDDFYMNSYEIVTIRDTYQYYIVMKNYRTWVPCSAVNLIKQCKQFVYRGK